MKKIVITLIKFYRTRISPMYSPCCKYRPTCSEYALQAVEKYGAIKGSFMAIWRILRCNPLSKGGYDPVK
ncbi:MAG: membrane protein insertion efficiency factor YidD [Clostridium sp.]|uniref:membrane protein insertion efficiency factor YidD n=1 Tax=Clostridium sp. TaxID=1506 RepID=UPI003F3067BC